MSKMPEGYPKHESKRGKEFFTFRFLKFKHRAIYDPTLTMTEGDAPNAAPALGTSFSVFVAGFLAAILALLA
jgi:hypothetical protein